jgi:hypothetical protein
MTYLTNNIENRHHQTKYTHAVLKPCVDSSGLNDPNYSWFKASSNMNPKGFLSGGSPGRYFCRFDRRFSFFQLTIKISRLELAAESIGEFPC